jgi:putative FmdB family regulatory protein
VPTYQYACKDCGHAFEQFQSFSDDALTVCPVCEGRLRKVFNAVGVVFKGSGFYRNDSRSTTNGSEAPAAKATSSSSSDGSSSESSSTPAATPAAKPSTPSTSSSSSSSSSKGSDSTSAA